MHLLIPTAVSASTAVEDDDSGEKKNKKHKLLLYIYHDINIFEVLNKLLRGIAPGLTPAYSKLFIIKSFIVNVQQTNSIMLRRESQVSASHSHSYSI